MCIEKRFVDIPSYRWADHTKPHQRGPIGLLVHPGPLIHRDGGVGRWRALANSAVDRFVGRVASIAPWNLRFVQVVDVLAVAQVIREPAIEACIVSVLSRTIRQQDSPWLGRKRSLLVQFRLSWPRRPQFTS